MRRICRETASNRLVVLRGLPLRTRIPALLLLAVAFFFACYTGWHLKQALDVEHELRSQMGDLSLVTTSDANASTGAVSLGESSLHEALTDVRKSAHRDEAYLALEVVGILVGLILLRRPAPQS